MNTTWDCIVVGGGAAGLSAALVLGRARRRTLVVDAGHQSNLPAAGIGGLLGHDHRPPGDLYAAGREELATYPSVQFHQGEVVAGEVVSGDGQDGEARFAMELNDGSRVEARRVLAALGMDYTYPDVPGIADRWGDSVFHCPFCHGWEVREQPLGVLHDERGVERASLLRVWSDDVTLFTNGPSDLSPDDAASLKASGVEVEERPIAELRGSGRSLAAVAFTDGEERVCHGLLVPVMLRQRSDLAVQLGAKTATNPMMVDALDVDQQLQTSVPGLFAAGDTSAAGMPSVANAIAQGSTAAAMIVHSLALGH